jgi:hypothetical protein
MRTYTDADKMTPAQVKAYVKSGGAECPFCKCDVLDFGPVKVEQGSAYQDRACFHCKKQWTDSYTLTGVI